MSESNPIAALADEFVALRLAHDPLVGSMSGIGADHAGLTDLDGDAEAGFRARYLDLASRAEAVPPDSLPSADRVTRAVIIQQAGMRIDFIDVAMVEFTVSDVYVAPAAGLVSALPAVSIDGPERARGYLDRLAAIPRYLAGAAQRHRFGTATGRLTVARLVDAALRNLDAYLAAPASDPLRRDLGPELRERQETLLTEVVRPAFGSYRDSVVEDLAPSARSDERPGLCWLPDGEADYARLIRAHTSTNRPAHALHDTGIALIDALAEEYRELGGRAFGSTDLTEIFARLRTEPTLRWHSPEQVLQTARTALRRATDAAPDWFGFIPPDQPCAVRPTPPSASNTAVPMYYLTPALDGSRPGVYYANTDRVGERARTIAEATAFHEGVPGHHFQHSVAAARTELPLLRRMASVNAYVEGWGLYCERLAEEMGLYSDDIARLGMLVYDSMRAGRLVVDIGLHVLGWSREQAVTFLRERTPMTDAEIDAEIDRYIGWPGQALAYMVGRLEIQRLRAEATRRLGQAFDLRSFHDTVLGSGALPLSVLDSVIGEWIAARN